MDQNILKRIGKMTVKIIFTIIMVGVLSLPFLGGGLKDPRNPLSHKEVSQMDSFVTETFTYSETITPDRNNILKVIPDYVDVPEGGVSWDVFGQTEEHEYNYKDEEDFEWTGVRPEFSEDLKNLAGTDILIQGYMFPLSQDEKQALFLLGPFPMSCPYHYHVPPRLIIEIHSKEPVAFSYDAVNIKGTLELVPKDDEYNVFYRLKDAEIVR